jgi:7-cyano-7-deazaguanine synthase
LELYEKEARVLRVVVLSSGGIDSSVIMLLLIKKGHKVFPLFVDYGQLAAGSEWSACQKICKYLKVEPERVDFHDFGRIVPSGLTDSTLDIEKKAFTPTRNLLFLVLGAAYGYEKAAFTVATGILANPIFPDQTKDFLTEAEKTISTALGTNISVLAPLISLDKRDSIRLARKYNLPIEFTYSCHAGTEKPCGKCISCKERIEAEKRIKE